MLRMHLHRHVDRGLLLLVAGGGAGQRTADLGFGVEGLAAGLDAVRNRILRSTMPLSSVLAGRRELRVATVATVSVAVAFVLALGAPLWTLALGPILFGVPHLLADVRYCIVRPGWHRRRALVIAAGIPLLAGAVTTDVQLSLAAVAGAAAAAHGPMRRRLFVLALAAGAMLAIAAWRRPSLIVMVHLHNVVALGLWWAWRPRRTWVHAVPLLAFVALSVVLWLLAGNFGGPATAPLQLGWTAHMAQLAPGFSETTAVRLVVLFCFAQAVHYAIWLRVVPDDDRDRPTPRTFAQTLRALRRELGRLVLAVAAVAALGFAGWAVFDLAHARFSYLRFGMFHVTLELCAAALLFIEGRPAHTRGRQRP